MIKKYEKKMKKNFVIKKVCVYLITKTNIKKHDNSTNQQRKKRKRNFLDLQ
jgi:hypothetical protein